MPTYGSNIASDIGSYITTIHEMAVLAAREINFVSALVSFWGDESGTAARDRSEYGTVTFNQMTDSDDLTSQAHTPSVQNTLTPAFYGAQFYITDRRMRTDLFGVQRDAARELGEGAAKQVQNHILSDLSSLTGGTVGTPGGTLTWAHLMAATTRLKLQHAPEPYYGILHGGHWFHLGTPTVPGGTQTNAPVLQDDIVRRYFVGNFLNTLWFMTGDITSGTAAVGGVFSREALGYDERKAFGIEPERDASRGGGGYELNATMEYAHGVWRPKFGVQLIGTSELPNGY